MLRALGDPKGGRGETHRFSGGCRSTILYSKTTPRQNVTKTILGARGHGDELVLIDYSKISGHKKKSPSNPLFYV